MPRYDFQCDSCKEIIEVYMRMSELEGYTAPNCKECGGDTRQIISSAPCVSMDGSFTYNGQSKFLGGGVTGKTEARVPINIIDQLPGGKTRVTRIGRKSDGENE